MYNFTLLISLYIAHIAFDFYLQPKAWIEARNALHYKSKELYLHSLLQAGITFILLNQFAAIGFLLAAKSIFRFGELQNDQDKKLTEYVMLGTLISFSISIFIGLATSYFVTQLPIGK
ncbi:MAG: DUF3307 domain-containing protein [Proteus sp. (in: enterobacteria)]|nr:DUF3307 domain-containing protein [Proteus sp. (in: enterobacteria)]